VTGTDTQLMKAVWFAQYYLMSSLPSHYPAQAPPYQEPFFGLGRTGLGKGKLGKNYQGHVMYDNEYYLLPAVLPFHPQLAKAMLRYRCAELYRLLNAPHSSTAQHQQQHWSQVVLVLWGTVVEPTRPTQPFMPSGSIDE